MTESLVSVQEALGLEFFEAELTLKANVCDNMTLDIPPAFIFQPAQIALKHQGSLLIFRGALLDSFVANDFFVRLFRICYL